MRREQNQLACRDRAYHTGLVASQESPSSDLMASNLRARARYAARAAIGKNTRRRHVGCHLRLLRLMTGQYILLCDVIGDAETYIYSELAGAPPTGRRIAKDVAMVMLVVIAVKNDHDTPMSADCTAIMDDGQRTAADIKRSILSITKNTPMQNARDITSGFIFHIIPFPGAPSFPAAALAVRGDSPRQKSPCSMQFADTYSTGRR